MQPLAASATNNIEVLAGTVDPTMRIVVESMDTPFDGTYAIGDTVPYVIPGAGDEVFARSTAPADGTLAVGDLLTSKGDGHLVGLDAAVTPAGYGGEALAVALEAKLYSAGVNVLVRVEVL
ncbi:MAG: hypothetical protein NWE89_12260 [Candidatus Bathyarchaeota archaeon]|nr:hypothetical protein [Candidatus Bathyarchaeota archaeon]